jgi:queuine/archaeosine tRNA-ribosyltransferase
MELMARIREAIRAHSLAALEAEFLSRYAPSAPERLA